MNNQLKRREFIIKAGLAAAACTTGLSPIFAGYGFRNGKFPASINKRDAVFELLTSDKPQDYYPVGFFIHFGTKYKFGEAAINKHLEYFDFIGMDFVKIQYELTMPKIPAIQKPADWLKMPLHKKDLYDQQLHITKEIIKKGKKKAPVIATLYSPFMSAGQVISEKLLTQHLKEDPEMVKKGLEVITESTLIYAKECIKLGVDGFLASTQGGEGFRFEDKSIFRDYIKPTDLIAMEEANSHCNCNILHICDHTGDYDDYNSFLDYPGQVVNCSLKLMDGNLTSKELYKMFERPFMGGIHNNGTIENGTDKEIQTEVRNVLNKAPEKFILGANCTLKGPDWKNVKTAVDAAHAYNS